MLQVAGWMNVITSTVIGLDPRRLRTLWISAAEGERFASTIIEFVEELKEIGSIGTELQKEESISTSEEVAQ